MIMDRDTLIQCIEDDLSAGIVNLELDETIINRNLDRAIGLSTDYFTYSDYKTLTVERTSGSGGYINLSDLDPDGIPVILNVYPTKSVMNIDAALLSLGNVYINTNMPLQNQLTSYANMINKLANMESILGRNARVVGDKLFVDHFFSDVTVEYIPEKVKIENINEGSWITWLIDYTVALSKKQLAQSRGKYVVSSNPATTNAATLLEEANEAIERLTEQLQTKGVLLASK